MVLSFAIIVSIAATAVNLQTMPEREKTGILSLNVRQLINMHLAWNTVRGLQ